MRGANVVPFIPARKARLTWQRAMVETIFHSIREKHRKPGIAGCEENGADRKQASQGAPNRKPLHGWRDPASPFFAQTIA